MLLALLGGPHEFVCSIFLSIEDPTYNELHISTENDLRHRQQQFEMKSHDIDKLLKWRRILLNESNNKAAVVTKQLDGIKQGIQELQKKYGHFQAMKLQAFENRATVIQQMGVVVESLESRKEHSTAQAVHAL